MTEALTTPEEKRIIEITERATELGQTVRKLLNEITPKIASFVIKAATNIQETAGKAQLSLKIVVDDHPKNGLYVELSGAETLCAGKDRWSAHISEDNQLRIDFPEVPA